jgi:hypothetical protein
MRLEADDLHIADVPSELLDGASDDERWRFVVSCGSCAHGSRCRGSILGRKVKCPKCEQDFVAEWGEVIAAEKR